MLSVLLIAQAAAAPLDAPAELARFDLRALKPPPRCAAGATTDIVVCGRRRDDPRLRPLSEEYGDAPVRAETMIGGLKASAVVEQVQLPGAVSNRLMVRLKVPF